MFYYIFLPFTFVASFINQGGYVLIVLFIVALYMWFLISERFYFYKFEITDIVKNRYESFQNSKIDNIHLIDSLINLGINVKSIFAPEHVFKINYGAGEKIKNESFKNIPIYSLYGDKKKPSYTLLENKKQIVKEATIEGKIIGEPKIKN